MLRPMPYVIANSMCIVVVCMGGAVAAAPLVAHGVMTHFTLNSMFWSQSKCDIDIHSSPQPQ